jgi:hypothetical protein
VFFPCVFVVRCVDSGPRDDLINGSEECYQVCVCVIVRDLETSNQAALARFGLLCHRRKNSSSDLNVACFSSYRTRFQSYANWPRCRFVIALNFSPTLTGPGVVLSSH